MDISSERSAESRSEMVELAPCIGVPPGMETFCLGCWCEAAAVFGRGEEVREGVFEGVCIRDDWFDLEGEAVRVGTLGRKGSRVALGACSAAGAVEREKGFEDTPSFRC